MFVIYVLLLLFLSFCIAVPFVLRSLCCLCLFCLLLFPFFVFAFVSIFVFVLAVVVVHLFICVFLFICVLFSPFFCRLCFMPCHVSSFFVCYVWLFFRFIVPDYFSVYSLFFLYVVSRFHFFNVSWCVNVSFVM